MGIVNKLLWKVVNRYPERSRIISRDNDPYLHRFYITSPVRVHGEWQEPRLFGLYLHYFYRGDADLDKHNHPWKWALSFILSGTYLEEREEDGNETVNVLKAGKFNFISHKCFHRITLPVWEKEPVWSLFLAGPKTSSWGFKDHVTGEFMDYKPYLQSKGEAV